MTASLVHCHLLGTVNWGSAWKKDPYNRLHNLKCIIAHTKELGSQRVKVLQALLVTPQILGLQSSCVVVGQYGAPQLSLFSFIFSLGCVLEGSSYQFLTESWIPHSIT